LLSSLLTFEAKRNLLFKFDDVIKQLRPISVESDEGFSNHQVPEGGFVMAIPGVREKFSRYI